MTETDEVGPQPPDPALQLEHEGQLLLDELSRAGFGPSHLRLLTLMLQRARVENGESPWSMVVSITGFRGDFPILKRGVTHLFQRLRPKE